MHGSKIIGYFFEATGSRRILLLVTLSFLSALFSNFAAEDPWHILYVNWPHAIVAPTSDVTAVRDFQVPILPGLYFGSVLALGAYAWKRISLLSVCVSIFCTISAWTIAVEVAYATAFNLNDQFRSVTGFNRLIIVFYILAGILGGLVGGIITVIGVSVVTPDFRTINNWSRTLFVAVLAGALLGLTTANFSVLFIVWQVSVAASIAFGWSFQETVTIASQSGTRSNKEKVT
jgi:hypothetical protein